ncbi:MAG TPA: MBL fold metallo-hydrolase [Spirochaetota bacterium]|nr:MBL fold metallo-hydrolase [Spirochaetota bacterium]HPQ51757.1 MBL fold metallo-hydrolase [Spirochaetota bacterium]
MIYKAEGTFEDVVTVAGDLTYPGYVIRGKEQSCMIDAGVNLYGPLYMKTLDTILGNADSLDMLFLTHSHYDHLGAAPYMSRKLKGLKIGGHERIEALLAKEKVLKLMDELSEVQRNMFSDITGDEDVHLSPLKLDYRLQDGDSFDLGGVTCEVYETPGHTKDSLSFFVPEIGALFPGEAAGIPQGVQCEGVQVEFLSSYEDYLKSIERAAALKPRIIGMAHAWVLTGDDAASFLERSYTETILYRKQIEAFLDMSNGDIAEATKNMARVEYDEKGGIFQERNAYMTNLRAQVSLIASMGNTCSRY